ncbi:MAG: phosphodiester glycosidase family protein [Candidatus Neomarinimicrobiota bacterium]
MKHFKPFSILFIGFILIGQTLADFKESTPVGPGVIYYHEYRAAGPWHFHILEIDLTNPWLHLQTVKANDLLYGNEKTSAMAARNNYEGHHVIGAINGDFYATGGIPINAQVSQGVILRRHNEGTNIQNLVFGSSTNNNPFAGVVTFSGQVFTRQDSIAGIDGVNETRGTNELTVFNKFFSSATGTNYWGTEVITQYLGDPTVNDTMLLLITAKDSIMATGHGSNAIPTNGIVLSGHGTSAGFLNRNCFVGDTIKIVMQLAPFNLPAKEVIGGGPRMLTNGVKDIPTTDFCTARHPRTAIGFNQDSTKLYFVVVDGRQTGYSVGMSLAELADYMLEWGIYQAMNLDGGGSTTMVVRNAIKNSPSDAGGERAVANALLLISTAPTSSLNHLRISPREIFLIRNAQQQFTVAGYDQYWNTVAIPSAVQWNCDNLIGSIDANGLFSTGTDTGTGYVYAVNGAVKDTVVVHITDIAKLEIKPDPVILKVGEQQQMNVTAYDGYSNVMDIATEAYTWSVSGDFGEISGTGLFTAISAGKGFIKVTYEEVSDSVAVTVGSSTTVIIDNFDNVSNWSITGTLFTLSACTITTDNTTCISSPTSGRLNYMLNTGGTSTCNLNCSIPISGTPTSVGIWVYGDGKGHWLRGEFQDRDNEYFVVDFTAATPGINWVDSWQFLEIQLENAIPKWNNPAAVMNYPIKWIKIYIAETSDSNKGSGTLCFDDFSVNFIAAGINPDSKNLCTKHFSLLGNYPNPFNSTTNFRVRIDQPGDLRMLIYDLNGRAVEDFSYNDLAAGDRTLSWQAENCPTGIYLYQLKMNNQNLFGKCVMIK